MTTVTRKRKILKVEGKFEVILEIGKGTKISGVFEHNEWRIKGIRKSERSDVDEARLKWFQQQRSDRVLVSGLLHMITFVLLKF